MMQKPIFVGVTGIFVLSLASCNGNLSATSSGCKNCSNDTNDGSIAGENGEVEQLPVDATISDPTAAVVAQPEPTSTESKGEEFKIVATWKTPNNARVDKMVLQVVAVGNLKLPGPIAQAQISGSAVVLFGSWEQIDDKTLEATFQVSVPGIVSVAFAKGFFADAEDKDWSAALSTGNLTTRNFYTEIHSGHRTTCGITYDRQLYCWGEDSVGQLGDGALENTSRSQVRVTLPSTDPEEKVASVGLGAYFVCAISTTGNFYCWGKDEYETVPDGQSLTVADTPAKVDLTALLPGEKPEKLAFGHFHGCFMTTEHRVLCWGRGWYGVLGDGSTTDTSVAVPVVVDQSNLQPGEYFTDLEAGYRHNCGVTNQNRTYCWGNHSFKQIGIVSASTTIPIPTAVDTSNLGAGEWFAKVEVDGYNTCGLTNLGHLFCWGRDYQELLGNDALSGNQTIPVAADLSAFDLGEMAIKINLSFSQGTILTNKGQIYTWGDDANGGLGNGSLLIADQTHPMKVDLSVFAVAPVFMSIATSTAAGMCSLSREEELYCWGYNSVGQLGNGDTVNLHHPTLVDNEVIQAL